MKRLVVYVAVVQPAMILFEDQIYFTYPPPIFAPPSEVVCAALAGPTLHNTSHLIQLGVGGG